MFEDKQFLVIGGASKAGTTSVFNYLSAHPEICASDAKETRFFLDADYPLPSEKSYDQDDPGAYLSFFETSGEKRAGKWKLEATPDYLYSAGTARRIHETLPNARLIFVLREPVSRLLSFYRFGVAMGEVPSNMTFEEYVQQQKKNAHEDLHVIPGHPVFCALAHGLYSSYLKRYFDLFGRSCIHVAFYEDLSRDPLEFMKAICQFTDIDEGYFDSFTFTIVNKGVSVRSPALHNAYWRSKQRLRSYLRALPKITSAMRVIAGRVDAVYEQANITVQRKLSLYPSTEAFIRDYYKDEAARLREMLGREIPWPESPQPAS